MRFLLLTQYFPPEVGAAQTRLASLVRNLRAEGHEVEIVTAFPNYPEGKIAPGYDGFYRREDWEGSTVHRFWLYASQGRTAKRLLNYLSFAATACAAIFVTKKPDWIFVNSGPLFLSIPGQLLSVRHRAPVVFNVSDLWPRSVEHLQGTGAKLFIKLAEGLERWSYITAKYVNAITDGVRDVLVGEKQVPREKVLFLPNGVDVVPFDPSNRDSELRRKLGLDGCFTFIYPGNHGYAHALENVLEAAELLRDRAPHIRVILIGGGSEKPALLEKARAMNLPNLQFHDPAPPAELTKWLDAADAGLVHLRDTPLASETRPAKMFPIMARAKPILYAGQGEGARLLKEADGGMVISPENPVALADAMIAMAASPELARWGANNRNLIERKFDNRVLLREWLKCLV